MMKIFILFFLILFCCGWSSDRWGGKCSTSNCTSNCTSTYLDSDANGGGITKGIVQTGTTLFVAKGSTGIQKYDVTDPSSLSYTTVTDVDVPDGDFSLNAPEASETVTDGTYNYSTFRNGNGAYTEPTFLSSLDDGDSDLTDGSADWTTGTKSGTNTISGDYQPPFWGDYSGNLSMGTPTNGAAYATTAIVGGTDHYYSVWLYVSSNWAPDNPAGYLRWGMFRDADVDVGLMNIHYVTSSTFKVSIRMTANGGEATGTGQSSTTFNCDTWYNFKAKVTIGAGGAGGMYIYYRDDFTDDFTEVSSKTGVSNDTYTVDTVVCGTVYTSVLVAGNIYFDQVAADVDTTIETNMWDDGAVFSLDNATMTKQDQVNLEVKCSDLEKVGDYLYVAGQSRGLVIFDVSNPADIQYVSSYNIGNFETQHLNISGNYAYMANYIHGIAIIDISDPTNPTEVGRLDFTIAAQQLWDVKVARGFAYGTVSSGTCVAGDRGFIKYNISNPASPTIGTFLPFDIRRESVCVAGDDPPYQISFNANASKAYITNGDLGVEEIILSDMTWGCYFDVTAANENIRAGYYTGTTYYMGEGGGSTRDLYSWTVE